jgi:Flp pilus assembly protein TadG
MRPARLFADKRGISITEFGLIAPVLMVVMLGTLDLGHTLYMQSVLQGAAQKAARDASLETGTQSSSQTASDTALATQIQRLAQAATVTVTRTSFRNYTRASSATMEPFTDTDGNGTCNGGEPYQDNNGDGVWDTDSGTSGQGGAQDTVVYNVRAVYPRLFPYMQVIGLPANVTLNATTVLVNQPYGDQAAVTVRNCP